MRSTPTSIPWVGTTLRTLAGSIPPRDSEDVRNAATNISFGISVVLLLSNDIPFSILLVPTFPRFEQLSRHQGFDRPSDRGATLSPFEQL
jgi:hypothetical protein